MGRGGQVRSEHMADLEKSAAAIKAAERATMHLRKVAAGL